MVVLDETYHLLNMDYVEAAPALYQIWTNDNHVLQNALAFYQTLEQKTGVTDWQAMSRLLAAEEAPDATMAADWPAVQAAHSAYQAGLELLSLLAYIADQVDFYGLKVNADLTISIPEALTDSELQSRMAKVLAPPPIAKSDEIVAMSGGMFYPREAPGMDVFVAEGGHFEQGDPLYIVEVMKMFNKVYAPFAGRVDKVLVEADGLIIKKGQPLFKVTPDEEIVVESEQDKAARRKAATGEFLSRNL
jgi:biotin carboxyl carrier protein